MLSMKKDKKEEEDAGKGNPFQNLEKTAVLQETRVFNDTPVNHRKCTHILTKILYLLNQGEHLGTMEATEAFFALTKLFQSREVILRRLVYLGIKELAPIAQDVIIVTSSLTKDMTGKEDLYRAAAIRALCSITDSTMLQAIERYMKQAIVDKIPAVSSAALVSSLHLTKTSHDVVKRWVNEAQEALNSDGIMVQYHALGLLYKLRKSDRLAVTKLVAKLTKSPPKSPYAVCTLIRIVGKLLEEEGTNADSHLFDYIESCLRHKSEMVIFEAANTMIGLKSTTPRELAPAISVLQLFCSSPKSTLRFAAVRTLNRVAMSHPTAVTACNFDLENLITDSNRSVATLAITTLLKTGAESAVDRLMKQIATFVSEISDEFKIVVVQAIRALCLKYPRKHSVLMNFLSAMLRDEGGLDYKAAIADTVITIIEENPEAKETGLSHLCEFIEDCEHTTLAVRILHLLGKEGPKSKQPSKYIRFIYNRVILESAPVRAAAVSSLARFGAACPDLLPNIIVLLSRCLLDSDDEVRDRSACYLNLLQSGDQQSWQQYILTGLQVSVPSLERSLQQYLQGSTEVPFDMKSVPLADTVTEPVRKADGLTSFQSEVPKSAPSVTKEELFLQKVQSIPGLAALNLGTPFKISEPLPLTESETEYVVNCTKHIFDDHIVLQFECKNTLNDQLLENVHIQIEPIEGLEIISIIPCAKLAYDETGNVFVCLSISPEEESPAITGSCSVTLKYVVRDVDPATGVPESDEGYNDEYMLEDVEIALSDYIRKIGQANFGTAWEALGPATEMEDTFALTTVSSIAEAVKNIVNFMAMYPCERTDKVPEGKSSHVLLLSGVFKGGHDVLVRAKLAHADCVTMQLTVRCENPEVRELIASSVG